MKITGSVEEICFYNSENGFGVVYVESNGVLITCTGTFPTLIQGQTLSLSGEFVNHPRFGRQFKVTDATVLPPSGADAIVKFLGSGLISGVGPKTAYNIVELFGERTLDVIRYNPMMLAKVKGVSKLKAQLIASEYDKIYQMQEAMMFLQSHGLTVNLSLKICKQYGDKTVDVVSKNPYRLIEDIDGVGFLTADKIAEKVGIGFDSAFRLRAGITYALRESGEKSGNTFLPRAELISATVKLLNCDEDKINDYIDELIFERKLRQLDDDGIMLTSIYRVEKNCAVNLVRLVREADKLQIDCDEFITQFERAEKITFHEVQRNAIVTAVNNGVSVITGGPGTGKTTIIKCILYVFRELKLSSALMAPTGRAAKRLSEACGEDASTIHRALMITGEEHYSGEKLNVNAVVVDEFSMVDVFLFNNLLKGLPMSARLIIVGDIDQLPSVGAGNVLKDVIASEIVPCVKLAHVYRQAEESLIVKNAHLVNEGKMPIINKNDCDFFYARARDQIEIADKVVDMASSRIPKYLNCEPSKVQVLCPMKNGSAGSIALNKRLQQRLNGTSTQQIETDDYVYRKGDKVMHVVNNYELEWKRSLGYSYEQGSGVFNGDIGEIVEVRLNSGEIDVLMEDGRLITYSADVRNQLLPAYAITVHKSQGSEFDAVIIPIIYSVPMICTRNLLYTAITRAKKMVVLVGEEYGIKRLVENNYIQKRYSALKSFIIKAGREIDILYNDEND